MKKIGLLIMVLIVALGALGIGYAAWTDEINITGNVKTGSVCLSIQVDSWGEVNNCSYATAYQNPDAPLEQVARDRNWTYWVPVSGSVSCPPGYVFSGCPVATGCTLPALHCDEDYKNVAWIEYIPHYDVNGWVDSLQVIIHDAYPYFAAEISIKVCNCGTIPVIYRFPIIDQDPSLVIEYGNNIGHQFEPGMCPEISWIVGVTQHVGYWDKTVTPWRWVVDDPNAPLTPQNTPLSFTIDISGIQWNEY